MTDTKEPEDPYFVEVEANGCPHCGQGRTYRIVGPDDVGTGTIYENDNEASEVADDLNGAYWNGYSVGKIHND